MRPNFWWQKEVNLYKPAGRPPPPRECFQFVSSENYKEIQYSVTAILYMLPPAFLHRQAKTNQFRSVIDPNR